MAHRLLRRSLPGFIATAAAVVAGLVAVQVTVALTPDPAMTHTGSDLAVVSLSDDASGALFDDAELVPGRTVRRCLAVRFAGTGADSQVRLIAEDLSGPLLPYLTATVAVGTGGGYAGCRGFAGTTIYEGPLTGLAGGPADSTGIATGWQPSGAGARTFAVTVRVADDNAAQGKSAGATLRWALVRPGSRPSKPVVTPPAATPPAVTPPAVTPPAVTPSGGRPRSAASPSGGPLSARPSASTVGTNPASGDAAPDPVGAAPASSDGDRSVTRIILSAFGARVSALRDTVAGSPVHLAASMITLLLLLVLAVLRRLRRRGARS